MQPLLIRVDTLLWPRSGTGFCSFWPKSTNQAIASICTNRLEIAFGQDNEGAKETTTLYSRSLSHFGHELRRLVVLFVGNNLLTGF